jgi:hypothetical protein
MSLLFSSELLIGPDHCYLIWTFEREIADFIRSADQSLWQYGTTNHPSYMLQSFRVNAKLYSILKLKYAEFDKSTHT